MVSIEKNKNILVILGPTASGKTSLAIKLASKYNGEIISADSRQIYKGMDVGAGKDLSEYKTIKYHLIDVISPKRRFSLADYQKKADKVIEDVLKRGKLPIVVGGSGLYLQALVEGFVMETAKPDLELRKELEQKTVKELFNILAKISINFASKLNNSDRNNKRRLIRYIELLKQDNKKLFTKKKPSYDFLIIGIEVNKEDLHKKINQRLIDRLEKEDMIGEVENLHKQGLSWERLEEFGLEYKYISQYLQDKVDYDQMVEILFQEIKKFAKRQMTWFRRWERQGRKINWIKSKKEAESIINTYLD